jgi:phenylpropionate dioxygenase-like ring-hydroxylating dioxygenase large terminal subunit
MTAITNAQGHAPFSGYYHRDVPAEDHELTHVGPGTPGGEYLRRFWHPVDFSSALVDLPKRVRILGEDLVLFRNGQGQVGLLALHCSHRGTSLEFGNVERQGIRCCYHGWLYGVDGRVLETPGEPADSPLKGRFVHGAYPTLEYKGLVFAYMGPLDQRPEFPIYDTLEMPDYQTVPDGSTDERYLYRCNWLQVKENSMDPMHRVFLHDLEDARIRLEEHRPSVTGAPLDTYVNAGLAQWERDFAEVRVDLRPMDWQETPVGMVYVYTRRVGEMVWVRMSDFIAPNIHQFSVQDACDDEIIFQRPNSTHWAVPIDDTHTMNIGFRHTPLRQERRLHASRTGLRGSGSPNRSYELRQRQPGDSEAQQSQRPIAVHALEHLGTSDRGVLMLRRLVREGISAVQRGEDPRRVIPTPGQPIPTYGQNTILRLPPAPTREEEERLLRETGRKVAAGYYLQHASGN